MAVLSERKVAAFIVIATLLTLSAGLATDIRYSDEIFHFWWAKEWYDTGERPFFNKLVDTVEEFSYFRYYANAPLWHFGLYNLMTLFGPYKAVAQVYQALFFALLLLGTYLLAKELYGRECAWYALVIVATVPVFVGLSVFFFIDVPIAALTPFLLLAMIRKRIVVAGFVLAAMFLMKRDSYFLVPSVVALALMSWDNKLTERLATRGLKAVCIVLLAVILNIPDLSFRYEAFGGIVYPEDQHAVTRLFGVLPPKRDAVGLHEAEMVSGIHHTEEVTRPVNIFKFLGVCLPILLFVALLRNRYEKRDWWLLLPCFTYLIFYLYFFKADLAVRYLSPIIPLLGIFAAKVLVENSARRYMKTGVLLICIAQMLVVLGYVYPERRITPGEEAGLSYVNSHIPEGSRILTPEELFVSYYTGRPTLWFNSFTVDKNENELYSILWGEQSRAKAVADKYKIKYVLVQQQRVYNDSSVKHYGGFPISFVKRLPSLARKVWCNKSMSIWQVQ